MKPATNKTFPRLTGKNACSRLGTIAEDVSPIAISRSALNHVLDTSDQNRDTEIGGFLLGEHCIDSSIDRPFIAITEFLPASSIDSGYRNVKFSHDTWADLHQQLRTRFPDRQVVGWHHTHPGFGIFLSRQDEFIHRNFFDQPWQVALVVDPRRGELGFFQWHNDQLINSGFLVTANQK